jgi:site-specific DNA recombinase
VTREEANEVLRALVERVELTPKADGSGVDAILYGDLARIFAVCGEAGTKKRPAAGAEGRQLSVVAGVGFEPTTFRL